MDADSEYVADLFDSIMLRCDARGRPTGLRHAERVVYYVVAVRTEADINGFCSVFEQLLNWDELEFFVAALRELGADEIALSYERIGRLLLEAGYYPERAVEFHQLPEQVLTQFDQLEQAARAGDPLWALDDRLAALARI